MGAAYRIKSRTHLKQPVTRRLHGVRRQIGQLEGAELERKVPYDCSLSGGARNEGRSDDDTEAHEHGAPSIKRPVKRRFMSPIGLHGTGTVRRNSLGRLGWLGIWKGVKENLPSTVGPDHRCDHDEKSANTYHGRDHLAEQVRPSTEPDIWSSRRHEPEVPSQRQPGDPVP